MARIEAYGSTDVGLLRTHNEDYFSLIEDEQLFIVADGMGGHASGEVASRLSASCASASLLVKTAFLIAKSNDR